MRKKISVLFAVRPQMVETTALGAAMAAGYAEGVKVWDLETTHSSFDTFTPSINATGRQMVLLSTFLV